MSDDCRFTIEIPSNAFPTLVHDCLTGLPTSYAIPGGEMRLPNPPRLLCRSLAPETPIDLSRLGVPRDRLALTINPTPTARFARLDHLGRETLDGPYELAVQCLTCYKADHLYARSRPIGEPTAGPLLVPAGTELTAPAETVVFHVVPLGLRCRVAARATPQGRPVLSAVLQQIGDTCSEAQPSIDRWRLTAPSFITQQGRPKGSGVLASVEPAEFHQKFWELYADNKSEDMDRALPRQGDLAAALKVDSAKTISRYCKARGLSWPPARDYLRWIADADKKSP